MNRFQFIQHLMETKRFTPSQKERFLKLASQEIGLIKPSNEELWEEIIKIKEKLGYNGDGGKEKTIVVQGPDGEPAEAEVPSDFGKIDVERLLKGISMPSKEHIKETTKKDVEDWVKFLEDSSIPTKQNSIKATKKEDEDIPEMLKSKGLPISEKIDKEKKIDISESSQDLKYIDPKNLSEFLLEYNQDQILKYTCHTIDSIESFNNILNECQTEKYEFKKHLELIHKRYNRLTYKFKDKVLKNIVGLISRYIGTYDIEEGWSNNIKIKWISSELELWCKQHPEKVPNPLETFQNEKFRFETIALKNGDSISNFSDLVIYFKNLFHIKSTNPLKPLIEESIFFNFNDEDEYKFMYAEDFSEKIDLFTYTEALIQAFNKIIDMSKRYYENEPLIVKLCFDYDKNNLKVFKIIILNSKVFGKNFIDFRSGDDIQNLIKYQINGLCNFYIKAYFDDKRSNGFVNIWDGKPMEYEKIEEEIEGVEFILKMY